MQFLMQKRQFAKELEISSSTVNSFINDGLPILKPTHEVTLIDLKEAEQWLSQQTNPKRRKLRGVVTKLIMSKSYKK
ncbi:hypothetical protein M670_04524 [Schinkia azotoformans MEV2011]|uniref:Uncharacterized protein n=1 Tax=Schinkia azotoformans MEV2011 TaxID=1348973 RepID=A0A072NGA7_SCHAZ|nr:hypothetical protein [Schinkia azotoformans]KEF36287.1 hypothetical protein M670_04524 [Schinkia azotoformans MEV2011]MEC1697871.1 hypothetical protein [Schinkia azotoformans]MEC1723150.1 hypothetical protein [Schinkia azotoformans]MEC1771876.1 hypothetical protein [Schinkia azotoformans]MEC1780272.1 hypothetical protein [Schinkia azotoformans]